MRDQWRSVHPSNCLTLRQHDSWEASQPHSKRKIFLEEKEKSIQQSVRKRQGTCDGRAATPRGPSLRALLEATADQELPRQSLGVRPNIRGVLVTPVFLEIQGLRLAARRLKSHFPRFSGIPCTILLPRKWTWPSWCTCAAWLWWNCG